MDVYVVMGHTSTYEDALDWVAKIFSKEEDAKNMVNQLNIIYEKSRQREN